MKISAATYLGDNTEPILSDLLVGLADAGFDIAVAPEAGRNSPDALAHAASVDLVWMCGYLSMVMLRAGQLSHDIVAAPVFAGEVSALYRSVLIVRDDGPASLADALAGTVGVNEAESWSGHHGLRQFVDATAGRWFAAEINTGAHRLSIDAVAQGRCDVAGIDVTIWDALAAKEPDAVAGLRVLTTTGDWPAPPFLIRGGLPADVRAELAGALVRLQPVGLDRIVAATSDDYETMLAAGSS